MDAVAPPIPFVPSDFTVPEKLETGEFRLRMLTVNDVVKDYDAVMSSFDHDAAVYLWARQSELARGLELRLHAAVKEWVARVWPFESVGFPGRDIAWDAWTAIANERR